MRRSTGVVVLTALMLLLGGLISPVNAASSKITVRAAFTPVFVGERPVLAGSVGPASVRMMRVQQRISGRWKNVGKSRSRADGTFRVAGHAILKKASFRVVAPKSGRHKKVVSKAIKVAVSRRGARLSIPATAIAGQRLVAKAVVRPVVKNRKVSLQIRRGGSWVNTASAKQNHAGKATLKFLAPGIGKHSFRVRYVAKAKAKPATSRIRVLTVGAAHNRLVPPDSQRKSAAGSAGQSRISADGKWVAYVAPSTITGSGNQNLGVFLTQLSTGKTTLVSASKFGGGANGNSRAPDISADGRYVTYETRASDIATADTTVDADILVYDRITGTNKKVSFVSYSGAPDGDSQQPSISADGRFIAYSAVGSRTPQVTNGNGPWIYVYDSQTGTTEVVAPLSGGRAVAGNYYPDISADGNTVVFQSLAWDLPGGPIPRKYEIYHYDRGVKTLKRLTTGLAGADPNGDSFIPSVSANGRFVVFESKASNLVSGDTGGRRDVFIHDVVKNRTDRISQARAGAGGNGDSWSPRISDDGSTVVFASDASNLIGGDTNRVRDIFAYSTSSKAISRTSTSFDGRPLLKNSADPSINSTGRLVSFNTASPNVVPGRTPKHSEVYVRDRAFGPK